MSDRVPVGVVVRAHGVRGDVLVAPLTDYPGRFVRGAQFGVDRAPGELTVAAVRSHKEGLLVRFTEIADRNAGEALAKATLTIDAAERRALEEGEYWPEDLIGLTALGPGKRMLGRVTDVILGAAQDRLVVTTPHGQVVEVPFVAAIVGEPAGETITMNPPDGLFEESAQVEGSL